MNSVLQIWDEENSGSRIKYRICNTGTYLYQNKTSGLNTCTPSPSHWTLWWTSPPPWTRNMLLFMLLISWWRDVHICLSGPISVKVQLKIFEKDRAIWEQIIIFNLGIRICIGSVFTELLDLDPDPDFEYRSGSWSTKLALFLGKIPQKPFQKFNFLTLFCDLTNNLCETVNWYEMVR